MPIPENHSVWILACPHCKEAMPILTGANRKLWDDRGLITCEHWHEGEITGGCGRTYKDPIEIEEKNHGKTI